jgi:hypothetical protein
LPTSTKPVEVGITVLFSFLGSGVEEGVGERDLKNLRLVVESGIEFVVGVGWVRRGF